jgi:cation diffusion facilitator CzcD-associated flavoprotein CzcO
MGDEFVDVLIVGAGLSGIGAAVHLQQRCPDHRFAIVEARDALGGTWDLFRYPGVRSDSDMHTLGYVFKPWKDPKAIAEGGTILQYLKDTAREYDLERHIRFGHKVLAAAWSTADARWTVTLQRTADGSTVQLQCGFLYLCSGYYDYAAGYQPDFPGRETFRGRWVHPQQWPQDLDHRDKRVVVIGSGATAVTLVPAMAEQAAHVTMLQRSPTWMASRPAVDPISQWLRRWMPLPAALRLTRWKNVLLARFVYGLSRRKPEKLRRLLLGGVRQALGPAASPEKLQRDFTPHYNPWDQRLCLVPDGDFFKAIREGRAGIVTDQVARITPDGIQLQSGATLAADIIVSATGLVLSTGQIAVTVDGRRVEPAQTVSYKGVMGSGVPNLATTFGYINASWTLKADLTAIYVCRLLTHMRRKGYRVCLPPEPARGMVLKPSIELSSGYFQRGLAQLPRQGTSAPWKLNQDFMADWWALRYGRVADGVIGFAVQMPSEIHVHLHL